MLTVMYMLKRSVVYEKNPIKLYEDYVANNWDREDLIVKIVAKYQIRSALYPGSYVHITPSFFIPRVSYVDLDKKAIAFFKDERIHSYIEKNKTYNEDVKLQFFASDYASKFEEVCEGYDLLISQYAGFISDLCKGYLKIGI